MFIILKNLLIVTLIVLIYGCSSKNSSIFEPNITKSVNIETIKDNDNILFKEHLKRNFKTKESINHKFRLKASISFSSSNTLSVNGLNALTQTVATVNYELYNVKSKKLIKSGSIKSFPALGSTSSSLYAHDINLKHIKERLNISIAKKLYMHLNIILRRLK